MQPASQSPAQRVIDKFGGIEATAKLLGRDRSVVNRWLSPREQGGTGGSVPGKHHVTLLVEAKRLGIELTPNDFYDLPAQSPAGGAP